MDFIFFETNLKSRVLCVFHRNDAVSRMLKAWDYGFQQSKSACVTVTIIYFWLHWISVAFFFLQRLSLVVARGLLLIVAQGFLLRWLLSWRTGSRLTGPRAFGFQ